MARRRRWIAWVLTLKLALASVAGHPMRTALSTLAVGVGVAGIVAVHSVIDGLDRAFESTMDPSRRGIAYVQRRPARADDDGVDWDKAPPISEDEVAALKAEVTSARAVIPIAFELLDSTSRASVNVAGEPAEGELEVYGVPSEWPLLGRTVTHGRFFSQAESDAGRPVVVIGTDLYETLRKRRMDVGAKILFAGQPLEVVGVLQALGQNPWGNSQDSVIVVPPSIFSQTLGKGSLKVAVVSRTRESLPRSIGEIVAAMRASRRLEPAAPNDFAIDSGEEARALYRQLTGSLKIATLVLALITLLISGGGILNIMLFSIGERTREIGLRGALGVRPRLILVQFLFEGIAISGAGGVGGLLIGTGIARLIALVSPLPAAVTPSGLITGLAFGVMVGLVFSLLPALRASRLEPAVAMRA